MTKYFIIEMATNTMIYGLVASVINEAEKYNDEENKCACCLEATLRKSYCGHYICLECYAEWRKDKSTCPSCRREYPSSGNLNDINKNNFMYFAKNFMRLLKCELCENLKCKCSVINKTFYNAIRKNIFSNPIAFYKKLIDIFEEFLIREFIYGDDLCENDDKGIEEAEEKIKITFWGETNFTIYKKDEDWKEGITINYNATKSDVMGDFDCEMLNEIANNCINCDEIEEFLDSHSVNMSRVIIRLLRNAGSYYLNDFLRSEIFGDNAWEDYVYCCRLYRNVANFPYIEIEEEEDDFENEGEDRVFAHIYKASEDYKENVSLLTNAVFNNVSPLNQIPLSNEERLTISNDIINANIEYENL